MRSGASHRPQGWRHLSSRGILVKRECDAVFNKTLDELGRSSRYRFTIRRRGKGPPDRWGRQLSDGTLLLILVISLALVPGAASQTLPSATEVLSMPSRSRAEDARLTISGHVTVAGTAIAFAGEGLMVFGRKPAMAARVVLRLAGEEQIVEQVAADGILYSRIGSAAWSEDLDVRINQPDRWRQARAIAMLPPEPLPLGDAWHVAAVSPHGHRFEAWVRQRDGYPLRFAVRATDSLLVIDYHDFDHGAAITGQPQAEIRTGDPARVG